MFAPNENATLFSLIDIFLIRETAIFGRTLSW
jgi:hypothetical protein